jgi:hypothetical protein
MDGYRASQAREKRGTRGMNPLCLGRNGTFNQFSCHPAQITPLPVKSNPAGLLRGLI